MTAGEGVLFGRELSRNDVEMARWAAREYPGLSRTELAATVCELIGWATPGGRAKVPQCLSWLARLDEGGVVSLPPLQKKKAPAMKNAPPPAGAEPAINACGSIELAIARPGPDMRRWRGCLDAYHPLGAKTQFGSRLHYFARSDGREIGCLQFSAAAWALAPRDAWIGWAEAGRRERLHLVANNSRCLILPHVRARNLASRILALAARRLPRDWAEEFGYAPVLLETFVDASLYQGTIYKAANWQLLGLTKGRGRMDRRHAAGLSPKAIYVRPLRRDFADILNGRKILPARPWGDLP
jgi:hypothetical protein